MKIFVTGGGGFLGLSIVRQLCRRGHEVVTYSRNEHASLDPLEVHQIPGDVADYSKLKQAMRDCEAVFHAAAKTGTWGKFDEFYATNVVGTENVLGACRELKIGYMVFSSTASVVYSGKSIEGQNERLPYPEKFNACYPKTKAIAEKLVMDASDASLKTVSIRPHLIWGPGDPHFLPRLIERSKAGRLRMLGSAANRVDCTYIENAANAHLLALDQLLADASRVEGNTYFISQDEPIPVAEFINRLLATVDLPPVTKRISPRIAYLAGWISERWYRLFDIPNEPLLTTFLAQQLSTSHWYDITAAKSDLGYKVDVSLEEGMRQLRDWVRKHSKQQELNSA